MLRLCESVNYREGNMESNGQDRWVKGCLTTVFSLGIVAVVVYMLFGYELAVYASLGIYAFAFALVSMFAVRKLFVIASYKDRLKLFESKADLGAEEKENYLAKKSEALKLVNKTQKTEIAKAIIFGAIAIFAVVVLVLF